MERSFLLYVTTLPGLVTYRYCGSGDKMFLLYHMTSRDLAFKGLCDLIG